MKKNYSLVLLSLLATANISLAMDAEDVVDDGNGSRSSRLSSGNESEIIDDMDDVEDNPEKQSVLDIMKPGFNIDAASNAIEWVLACIHDASIVLAEGKPTVDGLIQILSAFPTHEDQQEYLNELNSAFITQNPDLAVHYSSGDEDGEDDEADHGSQHSDHDSQTGGEDDEVF